ncbi:MAG TPA: hypothetical protein PKE26_10390 [Kiritimatiellia bacterium]|nr:hypothetical protein [Kiritimatiellia bacterium]HMO99506.1 hypothetical protein [Kiritimatiellia bacterium]HMP97861.1 hypothetical protein [Kiritimatiellia bacterium]
MTRRFQRIGVLVVGLLPGLIAPAISAETTFTLINGVVLTGEVASVSDAGMEIQVGRTKRAYPWVAFAPGTRFRFEGIYRTNLEGVLAGRAPEELTQPADPQYDWLNPDTQPQEPAPTERSSDVRPYHLYLPVAPVIPSALPAWRNVAGPQTAIALFQVGGASNSVLGVAFPEANPPRLARLLPADNRPTILTATRPEPDPSSWWIFPPLSMNADLGGSALQTTWTWRQAVDHRETRRLVVEVTATHPGQHVEQFSLHGDSTLLRNSELTVPIRPLIVPPTLAFLIRIEDGGPVLTGRVRMGGFTWSPPEGVDAPVSVEIKDAKGAVAFSQRIPHVAPDAEGYTLRAPLTELAANTAYTLSARIDLGAWLGVLEFQQALWQPDPRR